MRESGERELGERERERARELNLLTTPVLMTSWRVSVCCFAEAIPVSFQAVRANLRSRAFEL